MGILLLSSGASGPPPPIVLPPRPPLLPVPVGIPGTIGLLPLPVTGDERARVLLRFDEPDNAPAMDALDGLDLLRDSPSTIFMPNRIPAFAGRGLSISRGHGMLAKDLVSGSTLLTRDMTIQAIVAVDIDALHDPANGAGDDGTIYARGANGSAAEYLSAAMQIHVYDYDNRILELRMLWQDTSGTLHTQSGGRFLAPDRADFTLYTITRRWVSSSEVVLRYYIGAQLFREVTSTDGDIGGGTTGTTTIGCRLDTGTPFEWFAGGTIDEIKVSDYEMSQQEIEADWLRLSDFQPDGYRQILAVLPSGFPIARDPSSDAHSELILIGNALGFVDAQAENIRRNMLPDRAYGDVQRRWERITKEPARPGDSLDTRRARVLAHLRRHAGSSPSGVEDVLTELLDVADGSLLQQLSFDNTIRDDFSAGALQPQRWLYSSPVGGTATWDVTGGALRVRLNAAATATWDGNTKNEASALLGLHSLAACDAFIKLDPTNSYPDGSEAGLWLYDMIGNSAMFVGLRRSGANYQFGYQRYVAGIALETWQVLATTSNAVHWLYIRRDGTTWTIARSTTSATSGFTETTGLAWSPSGPGWFGVYHRTTAAIASQSDIRFDDVAFRDRKGDRPMFWYVYRDPGLGGSPDLIGAQAVIRRLKQAHTRAAVITSKSLLCDTAGCVCDDGPMGAL